MTSSGTSSEKGAGSAFAALGLMPEITAAVTALGYEEPTPIQREAIPPFLAGRDLLGQAATGTGKTAAFALPLLQSIAKTPGPPDRPAALVLVPTRELAMQVSEAVHRYAKSLGIHVAPLYGGAPMYQQIRALEHGVGVVVATPGRALDHLRRKSLKLDALRVLVLDEADEMLDMGFAEDLEAILAATPATRQTALFSATMPDRILAIAAIRGAIVAAKRAVWRVSGVAPMIACRSSSKPMSSISSASSSTSTESCDRSSVFRFR